MRHWSSLGVARKPEDGRERGALADLGRALAARGYKFTTVSPASHARVNARPGNECAADLAGVFGWSRPFKADILPANIFAAMEKAAVLVFSDGLWRSRVRASTFGGDLFFHSPFPTTDANSVFFGPDSYRFCTAIQNILRHLYLPKAPRVVDIGCGAGVGGITLARALPDAEALMVDINDDAIRMAATNVSLAKLDIDIIKSDLLSATSGQFDLIIANPPYLLDPLQRTYRHGGGQLGEGLSLRIIECALERLAPTGTLILYTGSAICNGNDNFQRDALKLLGVSGTAAEYAELDPDVFGEELDHPPYDKADRVAAVLLTATKGNDHA